MQMDQSSFVHNSLFAAQDHSDFDTMTSTVVPLRITTDSSGILLDKELMLIQIDVYMNNRHVRLYKVK